MPYQTADPRSVDYMYQMPEQLMLQAVQTSDANIDKISDQNDALAQYINSIKALPSDQPDLKQAADTYRGQLDNITKQIQQNPAGYHKFGPQLRDISRNLQSDPIIQGVQQHYNELSEWQKQNDKLLQEGKIDPILYQNYKNNVLSSKLTSSKYNPDTKTFGNLNLPDIAAPVDWNKKTDEWMQGAVPVKSTSEKDGITKDNEGNWLVTTEQGRVYMSPQRVKQIWEDNKNNDSGIQNSIQQYNQFLPKINPVNDPSHSYNPAIFNIGQGDYMASNSLNAALNKYSQDDRTFKQTRKADDLYKFNTERNDKVNDDQIKRKQVLDDLDTKKQEHVAELYGTYIAGQKSSGLDDKTAGLAAYNEAKALGINLDEYNKHIEYSQANNGQPIITTTPTTKSEDDSDATTKTPVVGSIGTPTKTPVPAPANEKAHDGSFNFNYFNGDNKLTSSNILTQIKQTKKNIDDITRSKNNKIADNDPNNNEAIKGDNKSLIDFNSQLNFYNGIHEQQQKDVLNTLTKDKQYTPEQIEIALNLSTYSKIDNQISQLSQQYSQIQSEESDQTPNNGNQLTQLSQQINQLKTEKDNQQKIRDKYYQTQDKWYQDNSEKTSQQIKYAAINDDDNKKLGSLVNANLSQTSIIDPKKGNDISENVRGLSPNNPLSYATSQMTKHDMSLNPNDPESLYNKLKESGKSFTDVVDITGIVAPAPGIGATVTFKPKDVTLGLDPEQTYLLKVPSSVSKTFATHYDPKDSENGQVIKSSILDEEKTQFLSNLKKMYGVNEDSKIPNYTSYTVPFDLPGDKYGLKRGETVSLKVIPVRSGEGVRYKIAVANLKDKDKNEQIPADKYVELKGSGSYGSFEEIANDLIGK